MSVRTPTDAHISIMIDCVMSRMTDCEQCGEKIIGMRGCSYCEGTFCPEHQLPEKHDCPGVKDLDKTGQRFDSGFDDSSAE